MVILTSFRRSHLFAGDKYSVTIRQPKGYNYDELTFLAPFTPDGADIRSRVFLQSEHRELPPESDFLSALSGMEQAIKTGYLDRWDEIRFWLGTLAPERNVVLCCWCPDSEAAKGQLRALGKFACHNGLIGKMIKRHRPDVPVMIDSDRRDNLFPAWKP